MNFWTIIIIIAVFYFFVWIPFLRPPFREGLKGTSSKPVKKQIKDIHSELSKAKGFEFEKYIARQFNRDFFTPEEWRSDKFVNGIYPKSNLNPDFEFEFHLKEFRASFGVECKYRSHLFNGDIDLGKEEQISRYKQFEKNKNKTVYIVVGLGGSAENPNELFLIPLKKVTGCKMPAGELMRYKKHNHSFFYDTIEDRLT